MPKDHKRNTQPLKEARKRISDEKYNTLKTVLKDMLNANDKITIKRVCELSGLSKSYLYQNSDAKQLFTQFKEQQEASDTKPYKNSNPYAANDLLLQCEELKRKLQDAYYLQYQLLTDANEQLKDKIEQLKQEVEQAETLYEEKKAYMEKCPKIEIDFFLSKSLVDEFVSYQFRTKYQTINPIGSAELYHIEWGTYSIISTKYTFELLTNPVAFNNYASLFFHLRFRDF